MSLKDNVNEVREQLGLMMSQFKALFPTEKHVERFVRVVMTAVQQNPDLLDPSLRTAFYAACMRCAQDGLLPDGKEAALVAYGGQNPTINYQPMVLGMIKKLHKSGEIVGAPKVHVVKKGDTFDFQLGDDERIVHKPLLTGRGETTGAYSIVHLKNGGVSREYMSVEEIRAIRERSKSTRRSPWDTDFDEMCRKTVFRRHYKKLPNSTDLDEMLRADDENFVPFEQPKLGAPAAAQAPAQAQQQPEKRPAALAAVAQSGGTPMPEQKVPEKKEPATIDGATGKVEEQAKAGGPPKDII